ncbi:glucan endo-1,3-beta-glucosidase [Primulina eburnea]|uniref:glucan endo-1,3-beta-glucosidase n=1 Tax=Primulina eburnea TaxID=1245227 RepID=UPI003C6C98D9
MTMERKILIPSLFEIFGLALSLFVSIRTSGVEGSIGVNFGTVANDLPPPRQVAHFLQESTIISHVRLFDSDSEMLKAFAGTDIVITVTIPNDEFPQLTKLDYAQKWVKTNILPHINATNIARVLVGNEVLSTGNKLLIANLVPAMHGLHNALVRESLNQKIKISTPHSLGILSNSTPPSSGTFRRGYDTYILKPLLEFLKATDSPFMINPYPFFGCSESTLDYALFRPNLGVFDVNTELTYGNMLDGQLDAVFSAIKRLGFIDIDIVIAETGWPSRGDTGQVGVDVESAAEYNRKLMQHVRSGVGTPLMRNRTFETYIFALFNEDLKPGPTCERNFGLFEPNFTPVYDIGILKPMATETVPPGKKQRPQKQHWCLPKHDVSDNRLQMNLDYVVVWASIAARFRKTGRGFTRIRSGTMHPTP